uniref:Uncharacterized protein n=1 Tax=Arundo donax TaxID=35708 RepID=A0A0A8XPQ9_ARUDO
MFCRCYVCPVCLILDEKVHAVLVLFGRCQKTRCRRYGRTIVVVPCYRPNNRLTVHPYCKV